MRPIALALPLIVLASAPSLAHESGQAGTYTSAPAAHTAAQVKTVVVRAPTVDAWSAQLSRSLGRVMRYPQFASNELPAEGIARVRFSCSDDGAPTGVTLIESAGHRRLDRAALDTVRRIKTLHPLPTGLKHDQRYVAALVFAGSHSSLKRQMKAFSERPDMQTNAGDIALVVAPARVPG